MNIVDSSRAPGYDGLPTIPPGRIRVVRERPMRVKDLILSCVAYVAEASQHTNEAIEYDPVGTGFFVSVPSTVVKGGSYPYFVTAKHVARDLDGKSVAFLVNRKDGGRVELTSMIPVWYLHPDTDVAIAVVGRASADLDILSISTHSFVTEPTVAEQNIGIGDDVFMAGLFVPAHGRDRNLPIVRMGNIAMMPTDQIFIDMGPGDSKYVDAFLIETRSIGGISGSPVFVRPTHYVRGENEHGRNIEVGGVGSPPLLLGLMHGHWDVKESELNRYNWAHDAQRGVNLGIGIVIPAQRILELLNDSELAAMRERADQHSIDQMKPKADEVK